MSKWTHPYIYRKKLADLFVSAANALAQTDMHMASDRYREMDCLVEDADGKFHQYAWSLESIEGWIKQCQNDKKPLPTIAELIDMSTWHSIEEPGVLDEVRRSLAVEGIELEERL